MVQPDCAGVIPPGPVSWYGVASPCADSGFAGTTMSQSTLAAVVVAVLAADGVALAAAVALGHGAGVAVVVGVAVAVPVEAGVAVAVPAVGDGELPAVWWPWPWPWPWFAAGWTNATCEAQLDSAVWLTVVEPLVAATIAPTTTASATGMAMATAVRRFAWLSCRRRREDRCLLGMQSTSMS
jgi:pimeloyl-ACP methyl ester carboxylesterase